MNWRDVLPDLETQSPGPPNCVDIALHLSVHTVYTASFFILWTTQLFIFVLNVSESWCCYSFQEVVDYKNVANVTRELRNLSFINPEKTLLPEEIGDIATILQNIVAVKEKSNEVCYFIESQSNSSYCNKELYGQ